MDVSVVILAAGQGKRMGSDLPKVLHPLAGRPMLSHLLATVESLKPQQTFIVYGHGGAALRAAFPEPHIQWVEQAEQLGTGHAVAQVLPFLCEDERVIILNGDNPLISRETLLALQHCAGEHDLALITAHLENPTGLGRIIRDPQQRICQIVEEKDASEAEKAVTEINSGIIAATAQLLKETLPNLSSQNQQGEYYLVDIFAMVFSRGIAIGSVSAAYPEEVAGVNDRHQLAQLERFYQHQQALKLLAAGTTILDPQRFDVRGQLTADRDCLIDINTLFLGRVHLGAGCVIGPNCVLKDCELGAGVSVEANSVLEGCTVGDNSQIGPFARLRPGTELAKTTKVGNFVEIKKSHVGVGTKINHLSYVGDATIGSGVNVGAGTITCNYDGQHKHRTIIENGAFIGSGTQLVAPITIGEDATVGAGSTITKDIPAKALSLTRALQKIFPNWVRRNS